MNVETRVCIRGAVIAALLLLSGAASAAEGDTFEWKQAVAPGSAVEIRNVNGGIEAGAASGSQVEIVAVKKVKEGNPADLKIEVVKHGAGITVCAVYPANDGEPANECKPGGGRMKIRKGYEGSVAFTVKLPANVRLQGRTVNGGIKTASLGGPADLTTVNGSIQVESAAEVRANTVNGSVSAKMDRTDWKGELELTTVNGSVKVELPASASTEVQEVAAAVAVRGIPQVVMRIDDRQLGLQRRFGGPLGQPGCEIATVPMDQSAIFTVGHACFLLVGGKPTAGAESEACGFAYTGPAPSAAISRRDWLTPETRSRSWRAARISKQSGRAGSPCWLATGRSWPR
jgi:hypothetical protein